MKPPIYQPTGKAKEYGDYALNIYTGCPHRCYYCFGPNVLHRDREEFHSHVEPRPGIVEETRKQLEREGITGKLIHLCFTCDPYPTGYDTSATREIIKMLKAQEPRVMTLEEIWEWAKTPAEKRDPIFFEQKEGKGPSGWICNSLCPKDYYYCCLEKDARCWTSRPTEEQRKAVKWDATD